MHTPQHSASPARRATYALRLSVGRPTLKSQLAVEQIQRVCELDTVLGRLDLGPQES